jgi:hypothetical protein
LAGFKVESNHGIPGDAAKPISEPIKKNKTKALRDLKKNVEERFKP